MRIKIAAWLAATLLLSGALAVIGVPDAGAAPITNFEDTVVLSGLSSPTAMEWAPDGRIFVAEKSGRILVFDGLTDSTPTLFADLSPSVYNADDRGLLGLEIDPEFPAQPYVYALYTYNSPIGASSPLWPGMELGLVDICPTPPGGGEGCVVSGRLSRLTVAAGGSTMTGTELVLIEDWCQQYSSHSVGSVQFGPDGFLYVTGGDGASFGFADYGQDGNPVNACADPPVPAGTAQTPPTAEGGALRAQDILTTTDPTGLDGTVIRVDRNGDPAPGNPFFTSGADTNARRIVAAGLRNPFRFTFRPGSSQLWIGEVGWSIWEEINVMPSPTTFRNFGWPCYEGLDPQGEYEALGLDICDSLDSSGAAADPYFTFEHGVPLTTGETCGLTFSAVAGLAFEEGADFPASYNGALFFTDYSRRCIWVMPNGGDGQPDPSQVALFATLPTGAVDLRFGPDGALYWVQIAGGNVHRIEYSANASPTAVISSGPLTGPRPLTVSFNGTASLDPEGGSLTYGWDLDGDSQFDDSSSPTPSRTYAGIAPVTVRLQVTDPVGNTGTSAVVVSPSDLSRDTAMLIDTSTGRWHVLGAGGNLVTSFYYGNPGDTPFMGDWNCDGVDTPGLYRRSDGFVYLRDSNTQGIADIRYFFGNPGDLPLAGDFDGDGCDTVSIYRPSEGKVYVINRLGSGASGAGAADLSYYFGNPGDKPFAGDFDGNGIDTIGLHRETTGLVYFRNTHTQGIADHQFIYGDPGDAITAGDWDADGVDTVAVLRTGTSRLYLRNSNSAGNADIDIAVSIVADVVAGGYFGS